METGVSQELPKELNCVRFRASHRMSNRAQINERPFDVKMVGHREVLRDSDTESAKSRR